MATEPYDVNKLTREQIDNMGDFDRRAVIATLLCASAIEFCQRNDLNPTDAVIALAGASFKLFGTFEVCHCERCTDEIATEAQLIANVIELRRAQ